MKIKEEDEKTINELYFDRCFSYSYIIDYFKGKYTYAIIRQVIHNRIEKESEKEDNGYTSKTFKRAIHNNPFRRN